MKHKSNTMTVVQPTPKNLPIRVPIVKDAVPAREILADWTNQTDDFQFVRGFVCAEDGLAELLRQKPEAVLMDIKLPCVYVIFQPPIPDRPSRVEQSRAAAGTF